MIEKELKHLEQLELYKLINSDQAAKAKQLLIKGMELVYISDQVSGKIIKVVTR